VVDDEVDDDTIVLSTNSKISATLFSNGFDIDSVSVVAEGGEIILSSWQRTETIANPFPGIVRRRSSRDCSSWCHDIVPLVTLLVNGVQDSTKPRIVGLARSRVEVEDAARKNNTKARNRMVLEMVPVRVPDLWFRVAIVPFSTAEFELRNYATTTSDLCALVVDVDVDVDVDCSRCGLVCFFFSPPMSIAVERYSLITGLSNACLT